MPKITKIIRVERKHRAGGPVYYITHALTDHDTADEVSGWGKDYRVGDSVQVFYDGRYHKAKMIKNKP